MASITAAGIWLPLGNAQIVDWRQLDREPSARGATAWITAIGGESTLVRTWCEETTTHFEFAVLTHARLNGRITVRVFRPEGRRLTVHIDAEVPGELAYAETAQFEEHPRTGLQGATIREVEVRQGAFDPADNPSLTAPQVEIFEYAPESALHTDCGAWLIGVLERVRSYAVDGPAASAPELGPIAVEAPVPSARREPPGVTGPASASAPSPGPAPAPRVPTPVAARAPTPISPSISASSPGVRLFAATTAGDSWEIAEDETFIGRSKQCGVVLKSQRVSRKHASVTRESEGWFINDQGAANGIWAGADKIDRELIEDGSEYIIGDVLLTFTFS